MLLRRGLLRLGTHPRLLDGRPVVILLELPADLLHRASSAPGRDLPVHLLFTTLRLQQSLGRPFAPQLLANLAKNILFRDNATLVRLPLVVMMVVVVVVFHISSSGIAIAGLLLDNFTVTWRSFSLGLSLGAHVGCDFPSGEHISYSSVLQNDVVKKQKVRIR
ncbi:hypothetical protein B0H63DRAFT_462663 [Podospora didyma]|uniref:Uncharacterized protein n=1 Tax=Podospora didyma TaxID=330526 RepID=A0AAE0P875_9PEZI|nr:hypothetical protein B0H63DRAFT_462663 [Podospora didyma]